MTSDEWEYYNELENLAIEVCKWRGWMKLEQASGCRAVERLCKHIEDYIKKK